MELRGNLQDFSLPDIIQLVGFGRKTGALRMECVEGASALYFEQGNVVHAEFPGAVGTQAVYQMFHVAEGEFRFQADVVPPQRSIAMDPTNLIMEAARLLDEARREDGEGAGTEVEVEQELDFSQDLADEAWFGAAEVVRDPAEIKQEVKSLLSKRFGRGAKKLLKAVDQCGDSVEELNELAERVEKYVHVFLDNSVSATVGQEIRGLIGGTPSSQ